MLSRWLLSLGLLGCLVWWLGPDQWLGQISALQPIWVGIALIVGVAQVALSAGRWWLTARSLGLQLSYRQALQEYYLGSLVNQVVPGGVVGDLYRAKRHGDVSTHAPQAWLAVIIERFSGQLMLALFTLIVLLTSSQWHEAFATLTEGMVIGGGAWIIGAVVICVLLLLTVTIGFHQRAQLIRQITQQALIAVFWPWPRGLLQVLSSTLIVLSYVAVMLCAAWAVGVELQAWTVAVLAPPLLLAMVVPITVAGWGLREWMAAGVWASMGLDPAQGVAVSVAYGVMIFLTALPGVLMWKPRSS